MPISNQTISFEEASQMVAEIIKKAKDDGGAPIAVAIVDISGRLKCFSAMDYVMPASIKLAQSKAYSAVLGNRDTINWANFQKSEKVIDFDMRNWTDENFSGFTGGIVIKINDEIIGGIGVSGRKGTMSEEDKIMQDNELATYGRDAINLD